MRYLAFTAIAMVAGIVLFACASNSFGMFGTGVEGDGKQLTDVRKVGNFTELESSGAIDVTVVCGNTDVTTATVVADSNIVPYIRTEVSGNTLKIYSDRSFVTRNPLLVKIAVPRLDRAAMSGSGDLSIAGNTTKGLKVSISGSSDVQIAKLKADALDVTISGSGDVAVSGSVGAFSSTTNGSGNVDARDLTATSANIEVHGSGDATVNVSDSLNVIVAGSGDVEYIGSPKAVNQSIAGSGSVQKL